MKRRKQNLGLKIAGAILVLLVSGCGDKKQVQNEQSYRQIGISQLEAGNYSSAITAFDQALAQREGKFTNLEEDIYLYKAQAQTGAGNTEDAIATYSLILEHEKEQGEAYYLRGNAYFSMGDTEAALQDYEKALEYGKDKGSLCVNVSERLVAAGLEDEAAPYMEAGLKYSKKGSEGEVALGRIYLLKEEYKKARTELSDALEQGNQEAYWYLGKLELLEENYEKAVEYFAQGLSSGDDLHRQGLWAGKIAALEYLGRFQEANEEMEAYLKEYPKDSHALRESVFLGTR